MYIDFIINKFDEFADKDAFILNGKASSYKYLLEKYQLAVEYLDKAQICSGMVIGVEGDFSPISTAFLFALANKNCIIVPLTKELQGKKQEFIDVAKIQKVISVNDDEKITLVNYYTTSQHELYDKLRNAEHPGLVFFSSGSTGASKGAVHDFTLILDKFRTPRKTKRMITFLLFDHMGGINTLLHNLSNGGCVITIRDRRPEFILDVVEKYRVEVLPVSPTFIHMMLLSESYKDFDLSSLDTISYGTEVMPESTLTRLHAILPKIRLVQTYGLSELGVMDTKSKSSDSLWVKLGGFGFETRVMDNMLEIKAHSAMLGYLNAPTPFTDDGWFKTMDIVEVEGDYYKILGRKSELINVGGEKIYPAEVESFFMEMDGVDDVAVKGEPHPIMGNIVTAKFKVSTDESLEDFKKRMKLFAKDKLPRVKVPVKIEFVSDKDIHNIRFKKLRK